MKILLFFSFSISACGFSQYGDSVSTSSEKNMPDLTLIFRASMNPTVYRVTNDLESGRTLIADKLARNEVRIQLKLKKFLAFRTGVGVQSETLTITGPSLADYFDETPNSYKAEAFSQSAQYLNVPIEFGFAPTVGKRGGFVPAFIVSVNPHFRFLARQSVVFNENLTLQPAAETQLINDFAGGMRETYTSLDVYAEFMFFVGKKKNIGFGPSFSVNNNFAGPQTFLLSRGFGIGAGLNAGWRL